MNDKYAVFIDIDGTLIASEYEPAQRNLDAIKRVREAGHKVFINTGRSYANIPAEIKRFSDHFDGFITGNGSHVIYHGEVLYSVCLSEQLLNKFCEFFLDQPNSKCFFEGIEENFAAGNGDWLTSSSNIKKIVRPDAFSTDCKGAKISVVAVMGVTQQQCREVFGNEITMFAYDTFFDCVISGCDKAKAMNIAIEHAGIAREHTLAIGDSMNDAEMLRFAGIAVAMGNAIDELKEIADYITDTNYNFGVAKALEKYLLR